MRPMHASAAGVELSIAKGWKPNMYLTNVAIAHFQEPSFYVAPDIFPILPVPTSSGNYYVFNKAELALDQVQRKPAFGKVAPAIFSHSEETYSVAVDQVIIGVDQIAALNYQRSGAPATIDPRRAKTRLLAEQMKIHLDRVFADGFFNSSAWTNVKTGVAASPSTNQFLQFDNANADIIGYFDQLKRDMLLNGRRLPNRLTLGYDVYVAIKNYKITVLGEVKAPGTYTMDSEKITILQALGRAGDLNLTAEREGILLIREENGVARHYTIDLKSAELLNSPYFYLQQNDVIYVPASASRVMTATAATGIWSTALSSVTTTVSLVTMVISLTRK